MIAELASSTYEMGGLTISFDYAEPPDLVHIRVCQDGVWTTLTFPELMCQYLPKYLQIEEPIVSYLETKETRIYYRIFEKDQVVGVLCLVPTTLSELLPGKRAIELYDLLLVLPQNRQFSIDLGDLFTVLASVFLPHQITDVEEFGFYVRDPTIRDTYLMFHKKG